MNSNTDKRVFSILGEENKEFYTNNNGGLYKFLSVVCSDYTVLALVAAITISVVFSANLGLDYFVNMILMAGTAFALTANSDKILATRKLRLLAKTVLVATTALSVYFGSQYYFLPIFMIARIEGNKWGKGEVKAVIHLD